MRPRILLPLLLAALCLACPPGVRADEPPATAAPPAPKAPAAPSLVIGEFPVTADTVVDGDTLRLPDGQPAVRVLAIDCEEVFKKEEDRRAAAADFAAYARAKRGTHPTPVKYGTPAGEAAREAVRALLAGVKRMRLERDHHGARERGTFGRLLAHVVLLTPEGEVHLAEAVIRAGHSPYFVKYGRSKRLDARLRAAQAEARKARAGIWSSEGPAHYPDYPERLAWWEARADQITAWERGAARPDHVTLGLPGADAKLERRVGKEAVVFGLFERELPVRSDDRRIFLLSHERRRGFALVVFDDALARSILARPGLGSMYVTVRGTISLHKGRPQMVIERPEQVITREKP